MTVNVFGSKINDEPHETYAVGSMHVGDWLRAEVTDFEARSAPPISITLNGVLLDPGEWDSAYFEETDVVNITLEPKGTELFFGALFLIAIKTLTPKIPKVSSQAAAGEGINDASIKGNKVKINSPIREIAGRVKVYPDYLLPPRRYFAGPREQHVEMLLCIGKGEYEVPSNRVLIGDTPAISLGSDVVYSIYGPGAYVGDDPAHFWWNDVTEVGSSSNGSAGLELTIASALTPGFVASSIQFNAYTVSIPSGAGTFPADWTAGLIVRMLSPYAYEFVDGGGSSRDIIRGTALAMLAPSVGDLIEISGINGGLYIVNSYTAGSTPEMTLSFNDGTPVTALTLGTLTTTIGPRGLRYRITVFSTSQLTVERLKGTGATDTGFPGFTFLQSTSASVALDPSSLQGGYRGPFALCPVGEKCYAFEWDVFFSGGLIGLGAKGDQYAVPATHYFEWRDMDQAGPWNVETRTVSAASLDAVGYTFRVNTPYPMRVEARIRRSPKVSPEWQDSAVWYGARGLLASPIAYQGVTIMSMNARGGDRLSAQSESLVSVEATRKLPYRVGGVWQPAAPTRDIAPWLAYQLKSIGYADSDIDYAELDRLDVIWRSRQDYFDQGINTPSTVKTVLNNALAAGFSELSVERGKLRAVRDEPRSQFEALYTPQNFLAGEGLDRTFTAIRPDDYDGVDVEYTDSQSWQVATVECRLPGDLGTKVQKITVEGVTSRTKAWRIGMRQRRALRYRRWNFKWSTELDALNSRYLSYVQVADDVPGYAQSAIMAAYDPATRIVEATEIFDWSDPGPHFLYVRRADGSASGPYQVLQVDAFRLSLDRPLDFNPVTDLSIEPPHLLFGIGYAVLITDISPNGESGAAVEAENYDARVYLDDNNSPPS